MFASQIVINMKPVLKVTRLDLLARPSEEFYFEISDFSKYFIDDKYQDRGDKFRMQYDYN